jgi:hypothetical protein
MQDSYFSYEILEEIASKIDDRPVRFYKRTRLKDTVERRFSESDIRELIRLNAAAAATVLLPSRIWLAYSRFASGFRYRRRHKKRFADVAMSMRSVLGMDDQKQIEALFREHDEMLQRSRMMLTIDERARRNNARIEFFGAESLHAALGQGKGAIVWASQFQHQNLSGKRALWEQGFRPIQISVDNHGISSTVFGDVVLNRRLRRAEERYLKDRIVFDRGNGAAVTRKIIELLGRGELILLTNNLYSGTMFVEMGFGKTGLVSMPTTPLSIVIRRGIPFFSMAILETEPFARLEAIVQPIDVGDGMITRVPTAKRDYVRMAQLALAARDRLFEQFRRAPEQFLMPESFVVKRFEPH